MLPENNVILNSYDIESIIWVELLKMHENFKFHTCLMLESFLISD